MVRLLRSTTDALQSLLREQSASADRRSDPLWLPGVKYLMIAAIESCIDVAQHVCGAQGWGPPRDNGDAMRLLGDRGVLNESTATAIRQAVGFRNVLVHEYIDIDDAVVIRRLADLSDLDRFVAEVASWLPT